MGQHRHCSCVLHVSVILMLSTFCANARAMGTFADFLASKSTAAAAPGHVQAQLQSSYRYIESDTACLMEFKFKNCRTVLNTGWSYFESGLTCCDSRTNSGNSLGSSSVEVGTCAFKDWYYNEPITEAPGVKRLGDFTVRCTLNALSDSCGGPFCDQMVLTAQGGVYQADDIVLASRPAAGLVDASCSSNDGGGNSTDKGYKGKKTGAAATAAVAAASTVKSKVANAMEYTSAPLYSGAATIYFGPMEVSSRFNEAKVSKGWLEYAFSYLEGDPISEKEAEGKHVINPHTYNLIFFNPSEH